jgi:hypothetical protein
MEDKDKDDNDEYKRRIKDLIEKLDKNTELGIPEDDLQIIEEGERIKQNIISKIHPEYQNEKIIHMFVFMIHGYYKRREVTKVPSDEEQYQDKIDELYALIYEELKKPSPNFPDANLNRKNNKDVIDKRRIFWQIFDVLGKENIEKDFLQKSNVSELLQLDIVTVKGLFKTIFVIIITVVVIVLLAFALRLI